MTCGIYKITNLVNGKIYIGCSKDIEHRWQTHIKAKSKNTAIHCAINKYGKDKFGFEVLLECPNICFDYWEKKYISDYNTMTPNGYNLTNGGMYKVILSEESKAKFKKSTIGRKRSDEARKNMSDAHKGKPSGGLGRKHTEESKQKMSKANKGRVHTEESRTNMSNASSGVNYYIYDNKTFRGLQKLADYLGCSYMVAFHHNRNQTLPITKIGKNS